MQIIKTLIILALWWTEGAVALAGQPDTEELLAVSLRRAPLAELPALAANLVTNASARDRESVTVNVLKCVLTTSPAALLPVVGAISRAAPAMAPVAARAAAEERPKQTRAVVRAACAGAPGMAGKVVAAVCALFPADYRAIAVAAAEGAPSAARDILEAVSTVMPQLKTPLQRELARYGPATPSVANVIDRAVRLSDLAVSSGPSTGFVQASGGGGSVKAPDKDGGSDKETPVGPTVSGGTQPPVSGLPLGHDPGVPGARNYARP